MHNYEHSTHDCVYSEHDHKHPMHDYDHTRDYDPTHDCAYPEHDYKHPMHDCAYPEHDYEIEVTESAQVDLLNIIRYMQRDLTAPITIKKFINGMEGSIAQLAFMPEGFQLVSDSYLASQGYRTTCYKNYLIFYIINENEHIVLVHRILRSSRQWEFLL